MNKSIVSNHGDIILYPVKKNKPPKMAKKLKTHILQESNSTENRHEVSVGKGFIYRWEKDGVEYLHCNTDYTISHLGGDCEHGIQSVEAGTREVRHEMEHNPWTKELRVVLD